jgi:hypothetical protein
VPRVLRWPALHFAVLGTALFVLQQRLAPPVDPAGEVVIPATRITARERRFTRDTGRAPTADERTALVEAEVDEELLYREALARSLDQDDRSIRGRLAEKMRFLDPAAGEDEADNPALARRAIALGLDRSDAFVRRVLVEKMRLLTQRASEEDVPDDAVLAAFMAEHAERWRLPARATVQHVFLRDGDAARAAGLLAGLRAGSVDFASAGDPFHIGHAVPGAARPTLVNLFGETIAEHALEAPPGEWAGPLRSPWGVHLVRVAGRTEGGLPAVGEVRSQLVLAWREERRQTREREALAQLRRQWRVRVEGIGA